MFALYVKEHGYGSLSLTSIGHCTGLFSLKVVQVDVVAFDIRQGSPNLGLSIVARVFVSLSKVRYF